MEGKNKTRRLTIIGILGAITIMLGLTPIGFVPIGPTRATTMHIPVIIGSIVEGPQVGMAIGAIFGGFSMIQAYINPTPVSFAFMNPVIALLPRILMGLVSSGIYGYFKNKGQKSIKLRVNILLGLLSLYLLKNILGQAMGLGLEFGPILSLALNILFFLALVYFIYRINNYEKDHIEVILSAGLGSLTNTLGVLFLIYKIYGERFVEALGGDIGNVKKIILGIGITNGIPEMTLAIIISVGIVRALDRDKR